MRRMKTFRLLGTMALLMVFATAAYAFTAVNTVDESNAGVGANGIYGYDVSDISYSLNASNPDVIDSVSFTLDPIAAGSEPPTDVFVKTATSSSVWDDCAINGGVWTCALSDGNNSTLNANDLRVAAAQ